MSEPHERRWFERPRAVALATWLGLFIALLGFDPWKFVDNVARLLPPMAGFEINSDILRTVLVMIGLALIAIAQGPTVFQRFVRHSGRAEQPPPWRPSVSMPPQARSSFSNASPLRITVLNPGPGDVLSAYVQLRVENITTAPVTGCEARLVQFRRMGEHEDLVPPTTVLGWQNPEARDGTITMQRPATWHFLQVEQTRRESAVGPSVRQRFFISTIGSNGLTARLEQYPLGPGTYVARVQVRPGNTAIETTNLVLRVDYTGEIGLSATLMNEDALS